MCALKTAAFGSPFLSCTKEHAPRRGGPGTCSDTYMLTYCLRHWFTRYRIAHGLHIVLRYKRPEPLQGMLVTGQVFPVAVPVVLITPLVGLNGGGGITIPWGISVDGDDNVWVANFGVTPLDDTEQPTILPRVSHFCGTDTTKCPARARAVGAAISPDNGYTSDALQRNTTTAVDPSGNLWLTNNWRLAPPKINPGGNSIVVYVGIARPIETPLTGPPISFD